MLIYILSIGNGFIWAVPSALLLVRAYEFVMKKKGTPSFEKWAIPFSFSVAVFAPLIMWVEKLTCNGLGLIDDFSGVSFALSGFGGFTLYGIKRGIFKLK